MPCILILAQACALVGSQFVFGLSAFDYAFGAQDIATFGEAWGNRVTQEHDPEAAVQGAQQSLLGCLDQHGARGRTRHPPRGLCWLSSWTTNCSPNRLRTAR